MVPARTCGRELAAVSIMKSIWPATENPASLGRGRRDKAQFEARARYFLEEEPADSRYAARAGGPLGRHVRACLFSHAINSFKFSADKAFFATMRSGSLETSETGSKNAS